MHWEKHHPVCNKEYELDKKIDNTRKNFMPSSEEIYTSPEKESSLINPILDSLKRTVRAFDEKEKNEIFTPDERNTTGIFDKGERQDKTIEREDEERSLKLKEVLNHYMNFQNNQALIKSKKLYQISTRAFYQKDKSNVFELIADGMLLVKCLLRMDKIQMARETLLEIWDVAQENISDSKIHSKNVKDDQDTVRLATIKKDITGFANDDNLNLKAKSEINKKVKKITSVFSNFASLFYSVGDFNNCEQAYVRYVKVIENNFGSESFEASNCFFLMGVFYLQHKYYVKAMACFKKALNIRLKKLGDENHECIADCYYNMSLIYRHSDKRNKAMSALQTALKIRSSLIGEISLPVAQVLEVMGKIYYEAADYKIALSKLQDCLNIRRKLLHHQNHPDILRIVMLIQELYSTVHKLILEGKLSAKMKDILTDVKQQMHESKSLEGIIPAAVDLVRQVDETQYQTFAPTNSHQNEYIIHARMAGFDQDQDFSHPKDKYIPPSPINDSIVENEQMKSTKELHIRNISISTQEKEIAKKFSEPSVQNELSEELGKKGHSAPGNDDSQNASLLGNLSEKSKRSPNIQEIQDPKPDSPEKENKDSGKKAEENKISFIKTRGSTMQFMSLQATNEKERKMTQQFNPQYGSEIFRRASRGISLQQSQIPVTPVKTEQKPKGLNINPDFINKLSTDQILELNELKSTLKKKGYQDVESDILNSEFYTNLSPEMKKELIDVNKHFFSGDSEK